MKLRLRCCVGVFVCLASGIALAADGQGNYAIWGTGGRSCNQFTNSRAETAKLAPFRDYMMGYLTAFNTLVPDTYDALGGQSLEISLDWLGEYCGEHKMDSFERAVGQLVQARHDQRARNAPGASRGWSGASPASASP